MKLVYGTSEPQIEEPIHADENMIVDKKIFLMCKYCFWCASFLSGKKNTDQCPYCDTNNIVCFRL